MISPYVLSINISKGGIPKNPIPSVFVREQGLEGDGHNHEKHYRLYQAVSLQDNEKLIELTKEGYALFPGKTGENLTVCHLNVNALSLGTILEFEQGLRLEIAKVRTPCYVLDAIDPKLKEDILGRCGMYAKVINEGFVAVGDQISVVSSKVDAIQV